MSMINQNGSVLSQQQSDYVTPPPNVTIGTMSSASLTSSPGKISPLASSRLRVSELYVQAKGVISLPHTIVNLRRVQVDTPIEVIFNQSYVPLLFFISYLQTVHSSQFADLLPRDFMELSHRSQSGNFFLVKLWADLSSDVIKREGVTFDLNARFEGLDAGVSFLEIKTQLASFGNVAVEKTEGPLFASFQGDSHSAGGHSRSSSSAEVAMGQAPNTSTSPSCYVFELINSQLCGFMSRFIRTLTSLSDVADMDRVLENFCVVQTITTGGNLGNELLLAVAFVFEVSKDNRATSTVFRLSSQ